MTARDPASPNGDIVEGEAGLSSAVLAEIAHELRTPLGGIEAMAALLCDADLSEAQQREAAEALLASVAHLRQVAGAILRDHRAQARQASERPVASAPAEGTVHLGQLLALVAVAARARAADQGLAFTLRVAEGVPEVIRADGTQLRQMIENLLDNAFKVTCGGGVSLNIDRIGRHGPSHHLRFAVRDNGPGFSAEQAQGLFEPLSRLDETLPGTGLGLSLVRRFARAMGGDAHADGMPGAGAIVWFTIVVAAPRAAAVPRSGGAECRAPAILVVDDNPASRMVMAVVLRQFGCEVGQAADGQEALAAVRRQPFDAVMMDMSMTDMDGAEATRRIRALPNVPASLPIIAVTGRVSEADQRQFRQAGANAFVPKPLLPRTVWLALRETGIFAEDARCPPAAA